MRLLSHKFVADIGGKIAVGLLFTSALLVLGALTINFIKLSVFTAFIFKMISIFLLIVTMFLTCLVALLILYDEMAI